MAEPSVEAVEKAFKILYLLTPTRRDISVKEASMLLNLPPSSTHRLLATLKKVGALSQDPLTKRYCLSLRLWEATRLVLTQLDIRVVARSLLEDLSRATLETVFLSLADGPEVVYIDRIDGPHDLRILLRIGSRQKLHCTASGLAILAFSPPSVFDQVVGNGLTWHTQYTITDPVALRNTMYDTVLRGYAINAGGHNLGVTGIAAPILGTDGDAIAAVSVSGPSTRLSPDRYADIGVLVRETARSVEVAAGFRPGTL